MSTALTNTGVFTMFPGAMSQPNDSVRRALTAVGHLVALVAAVVAIVATTVSSIVEADNLLASKPAVIGAYTLIAYVGAGIVRSNFRHTLAGFAFLGGLAVLMAIGQIAYQDASFFGWVYLGFAVVMAFVASVMWLDVRLNGRPV
jgi:uncharacterized membrane protein SirB2